MQFCQPEANNFGQFFPAQVISNSKLLHVEVVMSREIRVEDKLLHTMAVGVKQDVLKLNKPLTPMRPPN